MQKACSTDVPSQCQAGLNHIRQREPTNTLSDSLSGVGDTLSMSLPPDLEEGAEGGTTEDGAGLLQGLNLVITRRLLRIEVLDGVVALSMEVPVLQTQVLQGVHGRVEVDVGLGPLTLSLGLSLRLVHDAVLSCLDGAVCLTDEALVGSLCRNLVLHCLCLHGLGVVDDLLHHPHHAAGSGILLVGLEAWGWGRARRLLLRALLQKRFLVV